MGKSWVSCFLTHGVYRILGQVSGGADVDGLANTRSREIWGDEWQRTSQSGGIISRRESTATDRLQRPSPMLLV